MPRYRYTGNKIKTYTCMEFQCPRDAEIIILWGCWECHWIRERAYCTTCYDQYLLRTRTGTPEQHLGLFNHTCHKCELDTALTYVSTITGDATWWSHDLPMQILLDLQQTSRNRVPVGLLDLRPLPRTVLLPQPLRTRPRLPETPEKPLRHMRGTHRAMANTDDKDEKMKHYGCTYLGSCDEPAVVVIVWGCWHCGHRRDFWYCSGHYVSDQSRNLLPQKHCYYCDNDCGERLIASLDWEGTKWMQHTNPDLKTPYTVRS